ncbi:hypothetical protein OG984_06905 [Nocardioides sp. NBC_00368]|uniref:hypothetical protein n=1 Tax=Nocardioides sp. NBC_00368 TaxID=2976000 RepID=UPI002E24F45A
MSEDFVAVVRLDSADAKSEAYRVLNLLRSAGIVAANTTRDELHSPSEWAVGPRAMEALEDPAGPTDWLSFSNNGVDLESGWAAYFAMENEERSACPACGVVLSEENYADLINSWGESQVEPQAVCGSCGSSALLGDWSNEWPSVFGFPAVTFNNWPPLAPAFIERLQRELGGRTIVARAHY